MNLENNGERMDINFFNMDYNSFDIYQKSHYKRYEFSKSLVSSEDFIGDFACGSGYGSMMLSQVSKQVIGVDIDSTTINEIKKRYSKIENVNFECKNILNIDYNNTFDKIISFETIEHFSEEEINQVLEKFYNSLKENGKLIFSTPYDQEKSENSMKFHKTFYIVEDKIKKFLEPFFTVEEFFYQNYLTHDIGKNIEPKHFIICIANKKK